MVPHIGIEPAFRIIFCPKRVQPRQIGRRHERHGSAPEIFIGELNADTVRLQGAHMIGCPVFIGRRCSRAAEFTVKREISARL